jgi:hypothetical protein
MRIKINQMSLQGFNVVFTLFPPEPGRDGEKEPESLHVRKAPGTLHG